MSRQRLEVVVVGAAMSGAGVIGAALASVGVGFVDPIGGAETGTAVAVVAGVVASGAAAAWGLRWLRRPRPRPGW